MALAVLIISDLLWKEEGDRERGGVEKEEEGEKEEGIEKEEGGR